jgi:hypothetical protein
LGVISLAVGLPALALAFFGWPQTAQSFLGFYSRYICLFGSLGAIILGSLLTNESLSLRKAFAGRQGAQSIENKELDFLVMMEYEEKKLASA